MKNVKKVLEMTGLLFGLVTLFCYIGWHLGYDGLILVGQINLSTWFLRIICIFLITINFLLVSSFTLNIYSKKIFVYMAPFLLLFYIIDTLWPSFLWNGPGLGLYCILIGIIRKDILKIFLRFVLISAVSIGYQSLVSVIKGGIFDLTYHTSSYFALMVSIDMILLLLLIWAKGGMKSAAKLELLVFPGRVRDDRNRNEDNIPLLQNQESLIPLGRFEQWVMRSVMAAVQVSQWMLILWVCNLDNLFLDGLVITTSFICHGMIIQKRKHLKPIILCTLVATMMFYFAARFTISFRYSQFFPIIVGLVLIYTVYRISYQFEKAAQEKTQKDLERIRALEIQMSEAWKQIDNLS